MQSSVVSRLLFSKSRTLNRNALLRPSSSTSTSLFQVVLPQPQHRQVQTSPSPQQAQPTVVVPRLAHSNAALGVYPKQQQRFLSTTSSRSTASSSNTSSSKFAAVDHSDAYEFHVLKGRHGQQLALAQLEGEGKDDPPFDPFSDNEDEDDEDEEEEEEENDDDGSEEAVVLRDSEGVDDSYEDEDEEDDEGVVERRPRRRTKAERAILRSGAPSGGMFAVIELAGTQFKVTTDDVLMVNKLKDSSLSAAASPEKVGSILSFDDNVLLVSSSHLTLVGMPHVTGARVLARVEEITKCKKVIIFRKRRRKNWKRKNGFRREVTVLRILDILLPAEYAGHKFVERASLLTPLTSDDTMTLGVAPRADLAASNYR